MNLEDRIRQAIDGETGDPSVERMPEGLLRRARRRVAMTVAGGVLSLILLAGGSWALVANLTGGREPQPADTPTAPASPGPSATDEAGAVREVVDSFMFVRIHPEEAGDGPGAYGYLSEALTEKFDRHQGGLFLYSPAVDVPWTRYAIDRFDRVAEGEYRALVTVTETAAESAPTQVRLRSFSESFDLTVRPGQEGDAWDVSLVDVFPMEADGEDPTAADPFWVLHDFLVARIAGHGAEAYLSPDGAANYNRDLPLYATTDSPSYFGDALVSTLEPAGGGFEAVARLRWGYAGDSAPCPRTEVMRLEPSAEAPAFRVVDTAVAVSGWREGRLDVMAAEEQVCAFVHARLGYTEDDPNDYLSADAQQQYASREGGLQLQAPSPGNWGFWTSLDAREVEGGVIVHIVLDQRNPSGGIYEELLLQKQEGSLEVLVVSAHKITCQEAGGYICP